MTWKHVFGDYEVHTDARVRNAVTMRQLTPRVNNRGYLAYQMRINGRNCQRLAHRLVALAHIPNPANKPCVDHIDRNLANNNHDNLRWATPSENQANACKSLTRRAGSEYKGVYPNRSSSGIIRYRAYICYAVNGAQSRQHLGCYATEEEAARAYDTALRQHFGEFALCNLPEA